LEPGEALAILGPNGAGKSTLLQLISGEKRQAQGTLRYQGEPLHGPLYSRVQAGIGVLPQASIGFWNLSVKDNLKIALQGASTRRVSIDAVLEIVGLSDKAEIKAGRLSGGEKRRMEIGRCLTVSPSLLLLDEPFSALDPISIEVVVGILRRVVSEGVGVIFGDHAVGAALRLADRAIIIDRGEIIASGDPVDVAENSLVRQRYLGDTFQL